MIDPGRGDRPAAGAGDEGGRAPSPAGPEPPSRAERAQYTAEEQLGIRRAWSATGQASCPRCDVTLHQRAIGGGSFGLGYARRRVWLLCPGCRRSAIFDAARGTRT